MILILQGSLRDLNQWLVSKCTRERLVCTVVSVTTKGDGGAKEKYTRMDSRSHIAGANYPWTHPDTGVCPAASSARDIWDGRGQIPRTGYCSFPLSVGSMGITAVPTWGTMARENKFHLQSTALHSLNKPLYTWWKPTSKMNLLIKINWVLKKKSS